MRADAGEHLLERTATLEPGWSGVRFEGPCGAETVRHAFQALPNEGSISANNAIGQFALLGGKVRVVTTQEIFHEGERSFAVTQDGFTQEAKWIHVLTFLCGLEVIRCGQLLSASKIPGHERGCKR